MKKPVVCPGLGSRSFCKRLKRQQLRNTLCAASSLALHVRTTVFIGDLDRTGGSADILKGKFVPEDQ